TVIGHVVVSEAIVFHPVKADAELRRMTALRPRKIVGNVGGGSDASGSTRGRVEEREAERRQDGLVSSGRGAQSRVPVGRDVYEVRRDHRGVARREPAGIIQSARSSGLSGELGEGAVLTRSVESAAQHQRMLAGGVNIVIEAAYLRVII